IAALLYGPALPQYLCWRPRLPLASGMGQPPGYGKGRFDDRRAGKNLGRARLTSPLFQLNPDRRMVTCACLRPHIAVHAAALEPGRQCGAEEQMIDAKAGIALE